MKIGQVVVKITGREAGKKAVIVDIVNDNFVLIDGNVKRRKCNIKHVEPLNMFLKINKNDPTDKVHEAMQASNIEVIKRKIKEQVEEQKPKKEAKPKTVKKAKK